MALTWSWPDIDIVSYDGSEKDEERETCGIFRILWNPMESYCILHGESCGILWDPLRSCRILWNPVNPMES